MYYPDDVPAFKSMFLWIFLTTFGKMSWLSWFMQTIIIFNRSTHMLLQYKIEPCLELVISAEKLMLKTMMET